MQCIQTLEIDQKVTADEDMAVIQGDILNHLRLSVALARGPNPRVVKKLRPKFPLAALLAATSERRTLPPFIRTEIIHLIDVLWVDDPQATIEQLR